jgi:phosphoglycolate phosphatase
MPSVRGVVFDLDGTLIDSRADIACATNHALRAHGRPALKDDEIARYVGDGARALLSRAARVPADDPELDRMLEAFLGYYTEHPADFTRPMPGARELLEALGDLPLAVCTNKPRKTTDAVLAALGLAGFFRVVVADGDRPERKPSPEPILHIAERFGVRPAELLMVGDGPQDIECGRRAGATTVGLRGGIADDQRLLAARPDHVIERLDELLPLIRGLAGDAG